MNGRLAVSTLAAVAVAALAIVSASLAVGRSGASVITGTKSIGDYKVGARYSEARRVFGPQISSSESNTTCSARWANGVTISWHRKLPTANWAKACISFSGARVGKPRVAGQPAWRTDKGLRLGASAARLKALYPAAKSKRSGAFTVFTLEKSPKVSLQAGIKNKTGRVANFRFVTH